MNFIGKRKTIKMGERGSIEYLKKKMIPNWVVLIIAMIFYIVGFLFRDIYKQAFRSPTINLNKEAD